MDEPRWNDFTLEAGTMVRGALWLAQVVGEGNIFTKRDVRNAFPEALQADRRIRDLRDFGWVLHSNTEDALLSSEEQRLVSIGVKVWDKRERAAGNARKPISSRKRRDVLIRDEYSCTACGIGAGEAYPDDSVRTAVLTVVQRKPWFIDGVVLDCWATECVRCKSGLPPAESGARDVLLELQNLSEADRSRLARWLRRGRRGQTGIERAWRLCRTLDSDGRQMVLERLQV